MGKIIRGTYPIGFSIGVLILIFTVSCFLSQQIFKVPYSELSENPEIYFGMFLASIAIIIMILIIWEEILFPIRLKEVEGGKVFRNHNSKLYTQLLIFCSIPTIFVFLYFEYEVNTVRFFIWASICTFAPVLEKIFSGINNYNDFLKLTDEYVEFRNNEKQGKFPVKDIKSIVLLKDEEDVHHKINLILTSNENVMIDLDEMELEAFYYHIYVFINDHYKHLLKA
jgi:hypothetical protein